MTRTFTAPGELRGLLCRLAADGADAWRHDPEAAELMTYAMEKYAALARKHHLEPDDGAYAALTVLRTLAVRTADDPWSVVTRAVQISLIAEERANGLLCSSSGSVLSHAMRSRASPRGHRTIAAALRRQTSRRPVDTHAVLAARARPVPMAGSCSFPPETSALPCAKERHS